MGHQLGFHKDLMKVIFNKRICLKHTYILDPTMIHHHIIIDIQLQDQ